MLTALCAKSLRVQTHPHAHRSAVSSIRREMYVLLVGCFPEMRPMIEAGYLMLGVKEPSRLQAVGSRRTSEEMTVG